MGSLTLAYPSITGRTTQEQLESMRRYLCGMAEQLNLADWSARAALTEIAQAIDADGLSEEEKKTTLSGYVALKSLIIKTADFAAANSEVWSAKLAGNYVAASDFGTYLEKTQLTIEGNSVGIKQLYDYTAGVNNAFSVNAQQYIKTGLLYYNDVTPVYGVGVGNIETTVTDGGGRIVDRTKNELLTVTPKRISFWQEGMEVAYLSEKKLHFPSGTLEAYNAKLTGTITAAAGSAFGPWTIADGSIYRVENAFGSSAGMYFGTGGLSVSDRFQVDANGYLTCSGASISGAIRATSLNVTGATITGLTVDAANVTGNLSASRINGGILDFNNFSVNHLSANDITTGLLSADYIKLGGDMAVYDALNSGTVGGWLGYTTGAYGGAGIHMQSGLGEVVATASGAKLCYGGNTLSVTEGGAQMVLSIHMNEYAGRSQSGPQVFYREGCPSGRLLAGAVQEAMNEQLEPPKKRTALGGDYYILTLGLPSVLVECGFLSNAGEEALLLTADYRQRVAQAIARGIWAWANLPEEKPEALPAVERGDEAEAET